MQKTKWKIDLINFGIANRLNENQILINKKLTKLEYAPLLDEILEHEKKHTSSGYSFKDFLLDLKGFKNNDLYWKFIISTPKSWLQFLPFIYYKKKIYFDISVFVLWMFFLLVIILLGIISNG